MIYGIFGDTHNCEAEIISRVIEEEMRPRGAQALIHPGDIEIQHVNRALFGDLPMLCVLTKQQAFDPAFCHAPEGWRFVRPSYPVDPPSMLECFSDPIANIKLREIKAHCDKQRIFARLVSYLGEVMYLGHERSNDLFLDFSKVKTFFELINQVFDGVHLAVTGHTHQAFFFRSNNLAWLNPGAIEKSWNSSREFSIYDSARREAVFSRLSSSESRINPISVGILSDTLNVDELDVGFWQRCRRNFNDRGVTHVICCGNFLPADIGRRELDGLQVYYYLLPEFGQIQPPASNWHLIPLEDPVVTIGGHRFYVQHEIGSEQGDLSEVQRDRALRDVRAKYPHLDFIVAGLGPETVFMEAQDYSFINPGNARDHSCFAVVCLPRREYTFGTAK